MGPELLEGVFQGALSLGVGGGGPWAQCSWVANGVGVPGVRFGCPLGFRLREHLFPEGPLSQPGA